MQFGKSGITRSTKDNAIVSLGDDLKAAATDALKKCATLFGVGLHLYFDDGAKQAAPPPTPAKPEPTARCECEPVRTARCKRAPTATGADRTARATA
jgi:hypothetical protein